MKVFRFCRAGALADAAILCVLVLFMITGNNMSSALAGMKEDRDALVGFMRSADARGLLAKNWSGSDPCAGQWDGVICNKGRVWHVMLESRGLGGRLAAEDDLAKLEQLRRVSLKNNMLSGSMPSFQSPFLRCIWLSNNSLSGGLPDIFGGTQRFHKLDVSLNSLSGPIPASLASLTKLDTLLLNDNRLTGTIPALNQGVLSTFNVSDNDLSGPIPSTTQLQTVFTADSYMDNPHLCGPPLSVPCQSKKAISMSNVLKILLMVVVDVVVLCFMSLLAVYCYRRLHRKKKLASAAKGDPAMLNYMEETGRTYEKASRNEGMTDAEKSKLVVFERPGRLSFDLEELLRASAEVLGKGSFGTAYKALFGGADNHISTVVVKRLRDMQSASKREFDRQMLILGQLQHPNLVPLLAYYYAQDEKFLVVEYVAHGNLVSLLHGNRGGLGRVPLNWDARLKIARGVARGMAYMHMALQSHNTIPHGNLKSSNVLVDEEMVPKIADFGMVPLLTPSGAQCMAAYKAPEYLITKTIAPPADVHSFGMLLLELITGKPPFNSSIPGGGGVDLQKWICSKMEEVSNEWYDEELVGDAKEGEMEAMVKVAMMCLAREPEQRPSMQEALRMVEAIRIVDSPTTWLEVGNSMIMGSPGTNSFISDYNTPARSFSSHRSSFQHFVSPLR